MQFSLSKLISPCKKNHLNNLTKYVPDLSTHSVSEQHRLDVPVSQVPVTYLTLDVAGLNREMIHMCGFFSVLSEYVSELCW